MKLGAQLRLLIAIIFFAACSPMNQPTTAPIPSLLPSPSATTKLTPSLTVSPRPTQTQNPSPTPLPTETFFPELTQTPTPPGLALLPTAAPDGAEGASPNGAWLWRVISGNPGLENYPVLRLVKWDGSQQWSVGFTREDFQEVFTGANIGYIPIFWLPKEPYVFLAGRTCCGESPYRYDTGFRLARLNLATGQISMVIPGKIQDHHYFSFSLTGTYLLYTTTLRRGVHIRRLSTGEERLVQTPADFIESGLAFWSPDDTKVVLQACQGESKTPPRCEHMSLFMIDTLSTAFRPLVSDTRELWLAETDAVSSIFWLNPDQISVHMVSGGFWRLDLRSGERRCYMGDNEPCPH